MSESTAIINSHVFHNLAVNPWSTKLLAEKSVFCLETAEITNKFNISTSKTLVIVQ